MQNLDEIATLIPHRPPFLWVDRIVTCKGGVIVAEKYFPDDLDVFQGHFPGYPIVPGVLLCEAIFQSAAILMAQMEKAHDDRRLPFLTRITSAKFKKAVLPGDTARIEVQLLESVSSACYFKGVLKVVDKVSVIVDFVCKMSTAGARSQ